MNWTHELIGYLMHLIGGNIPDYVPPLLIWTHICMTCHYLALRLLEAVKSFSLLQGISVCCDDDDSGMSCYWYTFLHGHAAVKVIICLTPQLEGGVKDLLGPEQIHQNSAALCQYRRQFNFYYAS